MIVGIFLQNIEHRTIYFEYGQDTNTQTPHQPLFLPTKNRIKQTQSHGSRKFDSVPNSVNFALKDN